jgi:hypothetical protein
MLLAFASFNNLKVYHMDFKSSFMNGDLEEEVYIEQPEGFLLLKNEDYVCILNKELYGLKEDPKSSYSILDKYLQQQGFKNETIDSNIYIKIDSEEMLIIVFYGDGIIFGRTIDRMSQNFVEDMKKII